MEIDFNSPGQLEAAFQQGMGAGTEVLSEAAGIGLGGGAGLQPPSEAGKDSFLYTTRENLPGGTSALTASVCFQVKPCTGTAALPLTIGFTAQSPVAMSKTVGIPDTSSLTVSLRSLGTNNDASGLEFQTVCYNNAATAGRLSPAVGLEPGKWYGLSARYEKQGDGGTLTASIYPVDAKGNPSGENLSEITWTIKESGIGADKVYGLLSSQYGNRRGLAALDQYKITAE